MIELASSSNEWGTPKKLFDELCERYGVKPQLDVCATEQLSKCEYYFTAEDNALEQEWLACGEKVDVWMNPPNIHHVGENDGMKFFVEKAHEQWWKHRIRILAIIPTSAFATQYFLECVWRHVNNLPDRHVTVNPIVPRPQFLTADGGQSEFSSRNSYMSIFWH